MINTTPGCQPCLFRLVLIVIPVLSHRSLPFSIRHEEKREQANT